ncbi:MAG: histone deacetylase family protein [Halioglobus sp.]|nr:histone deacetylase family protein [Halioglobus sp.]
MFKIRQVHDAVSPENQTALSAVVNIYQQAFSYYPEYAARIAQLLKFTSEQEFDVILLVAETRKKRIAGFALSFYFARQHYAYLDYIVASPKRNARGYGAALYEATCEYLLQRKCKGLFMDVPTDDEALLVNKSELAVNRRRLAFYERFGARPIANTLYESTRTKANQGFFTYLVFDDLELGKTPSRREARDIVARILAAKASIGADDPKLKLILDSIRDDPVQLRAPVYSKPAQLRPTTPQRTLEFVSTGDSNQIHHLREKGYVERPARVHAILKGLAAVPVKEFKLKSFPEKHILAVHSPSLLAFLKQGEKQLESGQLLYPNVFPVRRPDRVPKSWESQAGYFCIDTFTPVTANAYKAARIAVNAAVTAAQRVARGSPLCYALCRPPGHHAETRAFGGFCYFNNAAVAAQYLSDHGKVALLDIDHHHGNGSQDIFYRRSDVMTVSIHGHPRLCYPYFAGYRDEKGEGDGKGFNRNYPLYPGVDDNAYCETLAQALKAIGRFGPDYLVLSLGFDIMAGDPTGTFNVTARGMYRIGRMLADTGLPLLIVQEGGYSLRNLRMGAAEFFRGIVVESPA